jgi:hypothetical protein
MALKYEWMTVGHAVVIYLAMLAPPAESKDYGILTRMLYAAFLAEQGMAICTAGDPAFASETGGPNGDMHTYVQHIKAEVTAGLSETERLSLLKRAADIAKAETLQAIRNLRAEEPENETARLSVWCQTVVKPLVHNVIDTHDNHHDQIDRLLDRAKKD